MIVLLPLSKDYRRLLPFYMPLIGRTRGPVAADDDGCSPTFFFWLPTPSRRFGKKKTLCSARLCHAGRTPRKLLRIAFSFLFFVIRSIQIVLAV